MPMLGALLGRGQLWLAWLAHVHLWELARQQNFENGALAQHRVSKHASLKGIDDAAPNVQTEVHLLGFSVRQDLALGYVSESILRHTLAFVDHH